MKYIIGLLIIVFLCGCGKKTTESNTQIFDFVESETIQNYDEFSEDILSKPITSEKDASQPLVYYCDLTHNGMEDRIIVDYAAALEDEQLPIEVHAVLKNGKNVYLGDVGFVHTGWGSYYITNYEEQDYLLYYNPGLFQGKLSYNYKVFYVDCDGKEIVLDEMSVNNIDVETGGHGGDLREFNEKLHNYLEHAVLLISIQEFRMQVGTFQ